MTTLILAHNTLLAWNLKLLKPQNLLSVTEEVLVVWRIWPQPQVQLVQAVMFQKLQLIPQQNKTCLGGVLPKLLDPILKWRNSTSIKPTTWDLDLVPNQWARTVQQFFPISVRATVITKRNSEFSLTNSEALRVWEFNCRSGDWQLRRLHISNCMKQNYCKFYLKWERLAVHRKRTKNLNLKTNH